MKIAEERSARRGNCKIQPRPTTPPPSFLPVFASSKIACQLSESDLPEFFSRIRSSQLDRLQDTTFDLMKYIPM